MLVNLEVQYIPVTVTRQPTLNNTEVSGKANRNVLIDKVPSICVQKSVPFLQKKVEALVKYNIKLKHMCELSLTVSSGLVLPCCDAKVHI